jgi:intraflagellar transport protein 172
MKLRFVKTLLTPPAPEPGSAISFPPRITAIAWAPNNARLAVVSTDRVVSLFDETGEKRDKFSTKAGDKAARAYIVTAMAFSPDSTRLLVAQSDNICFVYKLGLDWADKKSICNKFSSPASVTCATWPSQSPNDAIFGCSDGRVRAGSLRTNKAIVMYAHGAAGEPGAPSATGYVVSICSGPDGRTMLAGHIDGTIYRFAVSENGEGSQIFSKLLMHSCAPYGLAWGAQLLACGPDGRVCFYDDVDGSLQRTFDYVTPEGAPFDLTCAAFNPSGEAAVIGSHDTLIVLTLGTSSAAQSGRGGMIKGGNGFGSNAPPAREWIESGNKRVPNMFLASAISWKADGSRLAVGNITGACAVFDACLKRINYRNKFEFTYVSLSTVIVKRVSSGMRIVLRSSFGHEIVKIRIFQDRFLVAHTPATLLVGDLESCKLSEVAWNSSTALALPAVAKAGVKSQAQSIERYFFDNPNVCIVYRAGEATLIEYGRTEVLGMVRTEVVSPHLFSVRIMERPPSKAAIARLAQLEADAQRGGLIDGAAATALAAARVIADANCKRIAYLVDPHTLHVMDLSAGATMCMISYPEARIDWLELSGRGTLVIFRDKRRRLHLVTVSTQTRHTLLDQCSYAQWVPGSDVVVAQRGRQLCVWYNVAHAPEKVTTYEITGDIETIERVGMGKTEVLVDEGLTTASYLLDETLIAFGTAMDDGDLETACHALESVGSRAAVTAPSAVQGASSSSSPEVVEAMCQQLSKEAISQGAIAVAARCAVMLGDTSRARYLAKALKLSLSGTSSEQLAQPWLIQARLHMLGGDLSAAENLLIRHGASGGADAAIEMYQQLHRYDTAIAVAESHGKPGADSMRHQYFQYLVDSGQEERAAALKEHEGDNLGAISLYLRGGYPARALAVAMAQKMGPSSFPKEVLERVAAALAGAGMYDKCGALLERMGDQVRAMDAYLRGRVPAFRPAVELARRAFPSRVVELERSWGEWLVQHKQVDAAINHFIEAGAHIQAINAALDARQFSKAAQLVQDTLHEDEKVARPFWRRLAKNFQERGNLEEAERYLLRAGDGRAAVDLYLQAGKFEAAHRVARSCMSESEIATLYTQQAQRSEAAGQLRQAERLYLAVRLYDNAILMFRRAKSWDSVVRVVAAHRPEQLKDTHLAIARTLHSEGSFRSAERHFFEAGQAEQAVAMYQALGRWDDAMRCARQHAMSSGASSGAGSLANRVAYAQALSLGGEQGIKLLSRLGIVEQAIDFHCDSGDYERALDLASRAPFVPPAGSSITGVNVAAATLKERERLTQSVHIKRAMKLEDQGQYAAAEQSFIVAEKPREAVDMYLHLKDWAAAMRVADSYDPASVGSILEAQGRASAASGDFGRAEGFFVDAKKPELAIDVWFDARQYPEALRVAKQYLPNRVNEVADRIKRAVGGSGGERSGMSGGGSSSFSSSTLERRKTLGESLVSSVSSPGSSPAGGMGRGSSSQVNMQNNTSSKAMSSASSSSSSAVNADPLSTAKMWESSREFSRAVDAYLQVTQQSGFDAQSCAQAWSQALQISSQHDRGRHTDIADEVAHRLVELGSSIGGPEAARYLENAGDIFREIEMLAEAADCFVQAQAWPKAKEVAKSGNQKLRDAVDQAFKAALMRSGDPASMVAAGAINEAIAAYAAQGNQIDKVLELSAKAGPQMLAQHLYPHAEQILLQAAQGNQSTAGAAEAVVNLLSRYGAPPSTFALTLMRRLIGDLFSGTQKHKCSDAVVLEARSVLSKFATAFRKGGGPQAAADEAERLQQVVHYAAMRIKLEELGLVELSARASVSVLRFVGVTPYGAAPPADRAYFEAGMACKNAGWKGLALVLLNRFIDLYEAIEEGSSADLSAINSVDFNGSGLASPSDYLPGSLPRHNFILEKSHEEAKEWVLTTSMDRKVAQELPKRPCFSCSQSIFDGALSCTSCNAQFPSCAITGYPMSAAQAVSCSSCGSKCAKSTWNAVVGKTRSCILCGAQAKAQM